MGRIGKVENGDCGDVRVDRLEVQTGQDDPTSRFCDASIAGEAGSGADHFSRPALPIAPIAAGDSPVAESLWNAGMWPRVLPFGLYMAFLVFETLLHSSSAWLPCLVASEALLPSGSTL